MSSLKTGFAPRPQVSTLSRPVESSSKPGRLATRPGGGETVTSRGGPNSSGDRWLAPGNPNSSGDRWLAPSPPTQRPPKDSGKGGWLEDLLNRFKLPGWTRRPPESSGDRWLGRKPPIEQGPQDMPGKGASSNDRWLGAGASDSFSSAPMSSKPPRGFPVL